ICGIIGNALDNAIAGCRACGEPFIEVRTAEEGDMWLMEFCNNYDFSGKNFKEGAGLKSVRRTAAKYGGCVFVKGDNGVFTLRVLLNISRR
ncbi:MAG: ATP-binding protein, partial [Ruminococcus sp.]|nr:ATP-binding protein [Ruminococcus sp.]